MAMGAYGGCVYSVDGVCGVCHSDGEAFTRAGVRIVSGVSPRCRGRVWGIPDAGSGGEFEAGEVNRRRFRFFRPFGALVTFLSHPRLTSWAAFFRRFRGWAMMLRTYSGALYASISFAALLAFRFFR